MIKMKPTGELMVVDRADKIDAAFDEMLKSPLPGFQVSPDVSTPEALEALREKMQAINPGFEFDDVFGQDLMFTTQAHLDGGYAGRMAGAVLHENIQGLGSVTLQLVQPDVTDTSQVRKRAMVGPCLRGDLSPGMKTVFSNRIYDIEADRVLLGATFHLFEASGDGGLRSWKRYASKQVLGF